MTDESFYMSVSVMLLYITNPFRTHNSVRSIVGLIIPQSELDARISQNNDSIWVRIDVVLDQWHLYDGSDY